MSNRTLIEINHDYGRQLNTPDFWDALANYIRSAGPEERKELARFGVRVFGMRHHSEGFKVQWGTHALPISEEDSDLMLSRTR